MWTDGGEQVERSGGMCTTGGVRSERDTAISDATPGPPGRPPAPPPHKLQIPHSPAGWTRIKCVSAPISHLHADEMAADEKIAPGSSGLTSEGAGRFIAAAEQGAQLGAQEEGAGEKEVDPSGEGAREPGHTHIKAHAQDRNTQVRSSPPAIQISTSALAVPAQGDAPQSQHNWLSHASLTSERTASKEGHGTAAPVGSFWLSTTGPGDKAQRMGKGVDPAPWLARRDSNSAQGNLRGTMVGGAQKSDRIVTPSWDLGRENDSDRLTSWEKTERHKQTHEKSKGLLAFDALGCDPRSLCLLRVFFLCCSYLGCRIVLAVLL